MFENAILDPCLVLRINELQREGPTAELNDQHRVLLKIALRAEGSSDIGHAEIIEILLESILEEHTARVDDGDWQAIVDEEGVDLFNKSLGAKGEVLFRLDQPVLLSLIFSLLPQQVEVLTFFTSHQIPEDLSQLAIYYFTKFTLQIPRQHSCK